MSIDANLPPPRQLDIELAALLDSLSLQQRIRVGPPPPSTRLTLAGGLPAKILTLCVEADHDKRASTHRTRRIRHANERRRELLPSRCNIPLTVLVTDLETKPVRHYGLLKFLRRASLARGSSSSSHTSGLGSASGGGGGCGYYAAALRTPGISHALLRPGLGRARRAPDLMRGVPRADLHTPRGVRRAAVGSRGMLGGVQCARPRAGTSGLARR
jgi:hypothetical protein